MYPHKTLLLTMMINISVILSCSFSWNPTGPLTPLQRLSQFYLFDEVPGWTPAWNSHFNMLPVDSLSHTIGSKATLYKKDGLQYYFVETMDGGTIINPASSSHNFSAYVEDFGNATNSKTIFDTITNTYSVSDTLYLTGFSPSTARAFRIQDGADVFATFDRYYFKFELTGYTDSSAVSDAMGFLTEYQELEKQLANNVLATN
ncbi:MAG TPA: hypothetical protein VLX68_15195 [Chitinivibrionales bacterium]|nr:hypothetical protein [Chitinivibrionales bacterium]